MASSGNFMTWSTLWSCDSVTYPPSSDVFSGGNCRYSSSNSNNGFGATHSFLSGKWYWEVYIVANGNKQLILGLVTPETKVMTDQLWNRDGIYGVTSGSGVGYKLINQSPGFTEIDGFDDVANGDIVQLAFDRDNYKLWVGRNNTWLESGDPAGDSNPLIGSSDFTFQGGAVMPVIGQGSGSTFTMVLNAGQDDTFGGIITGAGNADENGHGVFKYAPPSGFLAVCSANLPISDDIDPAQTDDDFPQKQFNTVLYTGDNSTSNAITGLGFQPDFVWIKVRNDTNAYSNAMFDTSRGRAKSIFSDNNRVENTSSSTQDLVSFDSDGFTVGTSYNTGSNLSGKNHVAWCWKVNGGTTASNTDGSITTTVQVNDKAGISIIQYAGSSSAQTLGHGLSKAPVFLIVKALNNDNNLTVYHQGLPSPNTSRIYLNNNSAYDTGGGTTWNSTSPTSSVIHIGTNGNSNYSGRDYICYAFAEIEGYSSFGSYVGNGNADGPFIYTGFRPALVTTRRIDGTGSWLPHDDARNTFNPVDLILQWDAANAEFSDANNKVDFLSNGFKVRSSNAGINGNGNDYIYIAFASVPFKYNNTF